VVLLALMMRAWEQDPALAETSSFSSGNKSSLKFSPPALRRGLRRHAGKFPGRDRRWQLQMNAPTTDLDAGTNLEEFEPDLAEGGRGQIGAA